MRGRNGKYLGLEACGTALRVRMRSLASDRSGAFALMFALCSVPVLIALGCSFDYVQALNTHRRMQSALDAALLSASKHLDTDDAAAIKAEITNWIDAESAQKGYFVLNTNNITIDSSGGVIKASISATVPTTFMRIAGVQSVPVAVTSAITGGGSDGANTIVTKNAFSMYLVLDRSGSMDEETNTSYTTTCYTNMWRKTGAYQCTKKYTKIEALQLATANLMTQLSSADPDHKYVRTAAVSYNTEMQMPNPLGWGESDTLSYVQALTAEGGTASGLAFTTAYNALNDSTENAEHKKTNGNDKPGKYIVFMTDGDNNNAADDTTTKRYCDRARTKGITVYTIAFMAPPKGQALLSYCATTGEDYFPAENTAQLVEAFKLIGQTSSKTLVRLTQ